MMFLFKSFDGLIASIFMPGKFVRKWKVRAGHRMSTTKIISPVEEILETFEKQDQPLAIVIARLRQQKLLPQD